MGAGLGYPLHEGQDQVLAHLATSPRKPEGD